MIPCRKTENVAQNKHFHRDFFLQNISKWGCSMQRISENVFKILCILFCLQKSIVSENDRSKN